MKSILRRFYPLPFIAITYLIFDVKNPDKGCHGLIEPIINFFWFSLLTISAILAIRGCYRKDKSEKLKFEPIAPLITILTILALLYNFTLRGHTRGEIWIYAETKDAQSHSSTSKIILRKNSNFTISHHHVDVGCAYSGRYQKNGDTIKLNKDIVKSTGDRFSSTYLVQANYLIPLDDTANQFKFKITTPK